MFIVFFSASITLLLAGACIWQFKLNRDMRKYGLKFIASVTAVKQGEWERQGRKKMVWKNNYKVLFAKKYKGHIKTEAKLKKGQKVYVALDRRNINTLRLSSKSEVLGKPWTATDWLIWLSVIGFCGFMTYANASGDDESDVRHRAAANGLSQVDSF